MIGGYQKNTNTFNTYTHIKASEASEVLKSEKSLSHNERIPFWKRNNDIVVIRVHGARGLNRRQEKK